MQKRYEELTDSEKMIVALLYDLYRHHYSLGPANYVKASLIDDFKHHNNTYMYKDIENYITWYYFKAHEEKMLNKSEKSNLFKLSKDIILNIEKYKRIDEQLRKPKTCEKIIRFFYPKNKK